MKKIRDGYKITEIGEIPEEWYISKLSELAQIKRGASPRPINNPKWFSEKKNVGWIRISDVTKTKKYLNSTEQYLSDEGVAKSRLVKPNDLIMSICATVGKPIILNIDACIHDGFILFDDLNNSKIITDYLYYLLQKKEEEFKGMGQTGTQANLNTNIVGSTLIAIPTIKEQKKIASILSTVDEQIDNIDALIEKNKELKKGLMQTLLTKGIGHTKFKKTEIGEIPEEWEVKNLSEVVWYQEGPGLRKWQFTSAGIKVINVTNLVGNYLDLSNTSRYIDESEVEKKYKHFLIDENDIVVASSGNSWGKVSVVRKRDLPLLMNTSVIRFKSMEEERLSTKYLLQFLKSDAFKKQIALLITGSAQPNFGPYHLDRTKIATPNINEQLKIASILSEADEKIKKYENKKQKLEELKKGLMQQLLTGKIRVI